jgi:hypothetical protein
MIGSALALQAALAAAGAIGRAAHRLHPVRPAPAEVAALLRDASAGGAAIVARAMAGARYQNRLLVDVARRGGQGAIARLVEPASVERLRGLRAGPAILVGWHIGPPFGVLGGLEAAGVPALVVRRAFGGRPRPLFDAATVDGGARDRSAAFRQALARLHAGGVVVVVADATDVGETAPVPCLGRARTMARGPFALARRTGAPLLPVAARMLAAGRIEVALGAPLIGAGERDALETSLAAAAAAWLEAFVGESPGQLRRCVLAWLADAPRLA